MVPVRPRRQARMERTKARSGHLRGRLRVSKEYRGVILVEAKDLKLYEVGNAKCLEKFELVFEGD